ncbi:MAG: triose-phosphate isomerase [Acidobacteria bacterium]|nr:MAG: triose-phosphate isomerase [Acidobacteriota bacterium]
MASGRKRRRPIVTANWKMHGDLASLSVLAAAIGDKTAGSSVEVVLCPPFPYLIPIAATLDGTIRLGAQDVHFEGPGPHTGDVAASMLADLGCRYAIVGHSERRANHGETDETVRRKAAALMEAGVHPIVCVGETLEQRESGETEAVLERQLAESLRGLTADADRFVIAYEPVWAIGTGRTATPEQGQRAHAFLRQRLGSIESAEVAECVRIQYGGSVTRDNAAALFSCSDIDGGLIGGASLDAGSFAAIVAACVA